MKLLKGYILNGSEKVPAEILSNLADLHKWLEKILPSTPVRSQGTLSIRFFKKEDGEISYTDETAYYSREETLEERNEREIKEGVLRKKRVKTAARQLLQTLEELGVSGSVVEEVKRELEK